MSYSTLMQSSRDVELTDRLSAAIAKEAWLNENLNDTYIGKSVQTSGPDFIVSRFIWPLCINVEADYAYAINTSNPNPGSEGVVPDAAILNAVQTNWPADPEPEPEPE